MQSAFSGIEIGKRGLVSHSTGLSTIGHNLSNASTEGYSRQRVEMKPYDPIYNPSLNRETTPGQIGQGTQVTSITRVQDEILEGRIVKQSNGLGYWETRDKYLLMLEQTHLEVDDQYSVRSLMDNFWNSWQELSYYPSEPAARRSVVQSGEALIDGIHLQYNGLKDIRDMIDQDIQVTVERVNKLSGDIAKLNREIVKSEALGDNPNDLLDQRDLLVKELSSIMNITVDGRDGDEYNIHTGGLQLVQGSLVMPLAYAPQVGNEGYGKVVWSENGVDLDLKGGSLAALIELRDDDARQEIQKLDTMTINFIDLVNENHRAGYGLNGQSGIDFFNEHPFVINSQGNYDRTGNGDFDSTYLFRVTGANTLDGGEQLGLAGTVTLPSSNGLIEVAYNPTDTVDDLIARINTSGSEVVARLDRDGRLSLKGTAPDALGNPDFVIRHLEDSGQFLTGYAGVLNASGEEGAYDWEQADAVNLLRGGDLDFQVAPYRHPSGWIEVNRSIINDNGMIAAGYGVNGRSAETGDGSAALAIAELRNTNVMVGRIASFDSYFADAVAEIGLKGETAARSLNAEEAIMKDLEDTRQAISGVNMDEELAEMIKFQHGYSAAARYINTVNEMLDTIINRLGV